MKNRVSWYLEIEGPKGLKCKSVARDCDEIYVSESTMLVFYDGHKTERVGLSDVKKITFYPKEAQQLSYSRRICGKC
jgi:hypothetical protein